MKQTKHFKLLLAIVALAVLLAIVLVACNNKKEQNNTNGNSNGTSGDIDIEGGTGNFWKYFTPDEIRTYLNFASAAPEGFGRQVLAEMSSDEDGEIEYYIVLSEYAFETADENDGTYVSIHYYSTDSEAKEVVDEDADVIEDGEYAFAEGNKAFYGSGDKNFYSDKVLAAANSSGQFTEKQSKQIESIFKETESKQYDVCAFSYYSLNSDDMHERLFDLAYVPLDSNCYCETGFFSGSDSELFDDYYDIKSAIGTEFTDDSYVDYEREQGSVYFRYKNMPGFRFEDILDDNNIPTGEACVVGYYYDNAAGKNANIPSTTPDGKPVTQLGRETTVNDYSVFDDDVISVVIPDSVIRIDDTAFIDCASLTSVIFENPNGWYRTNNWNYVGGINIDPNELQDPSTAAYYLRTGGYWYRKED